ncbi:MAG: NAD-dependent DNA ligase LigA [bacterium]|nr:NAD-dependent DNA ligase LigA [bacterium]MDZ4296276.1 NAD-dependent DNA ligase LigA [Patescibacteria group bacterium]MDZ4296277.1 NAD-dependent DNA ligase LigA [Patescibacteria group bacterium]
MTKSEAKKRVEALRREINYHRYRYHVLDRQEISEAALDSLKKELFDLEQQFPEFITPDSPTQRVGGRVLEKFAKVPHPQPMLSFNDAFSLDDMNAWEERIKRLLPNGTGLDYFCELKIDGLAIELIYRNGLLAKGATRGDGLIGEDITQNLKTIEAIPLRVREPSEWPQESVQMVKAPSIRTLPKEIVVRGEVFITKKEFAKLNEAQAAKGESVYANPRNVAAGSLRQLNPNITASRRLDSFAYALVTDMGQETHADEHVLLDLLGFKINPDNAPVGNLREVELYHAFWTRSRDELPYEIDGIVVLVNRNEYFRRLGVVGKAPRGAIAYKFAAREATTIIEDIIVQVGRTGALTPVALLRPVSLGGVKVSRATLHNEDEIKRLHLKIGDTVIVQRAGDVIPKIMSVLERTRTGEEREFHFPGRCPLCASPVIRKAGEAMYFCTNQQCFGQQRERTIHFVAKNAFDIAGLGDKIIEQLLDEGLIADPADLFKLTEGDLMPLERFAEKSARKLVEMIQSRKAIALPRFLVALSIRHVGEETALDLARNFGTLEALMEASLEELERLPNIGAVVAQSIREWFSDNANRAFIDKLQAVGVRVERETTAKTKGKFTGLAFVFTGELETLSRAEAQAKARELGADVSASVSKNTDYVVAGENPGSKHDKAKQLGVKIITEKEFLGMVR